LIIKGIHAGLSIVVLKLQIPPFTESEAVSVILVPSGISEIVMVPVSSAPGLSPLTVPAEDVITKVLPVFPPEKAIVAVYVSSVSPATVVLQVAFVLAKTVVHVAAVGVQPAPEPRE
jgi:hypothetical protein